MDGLNRVTLFGNIGSEPEFRQTDNTSVLKFRIATNESFLDQNKERTERTDWHSVVLFGNRATALSKFLTKGSTILVEGSLRTSSYEKDGTKIYKTEVIANNIILAGGKRPDASPPVVAANGNAKAGTTDNSFPWDTSANAAE